MPASPELQLPGLMSQRETNRRGEIDFQKILLGFIAPIILLVAGIAAMMWMGVAQPKQVAPIGDSEAAKLSLLQVVETRTVRKFPEGSTLDIDSTGVVVPFRELTVAAEVAGRIVEKSEACRAGRYVEKGDLLFRIDPNDFRLAVDAAMRSRDQAIAQLSELSQEIENAERMVELASEDVELAEREMERLQSVAQGIISASELDVAKRNRLSSMNQKMNAQNQMDLLQARATRLEAAAAAAKTQLEQAELNLQRTEISAPVSGVIVSEAVEQDSFVQRGANLCVIEDTSKVEVVVQLRADQLLSILANEGGANKSAGMSGNGMSGNVADRYELPPADVVVSYTVTGREKQEFRWLGKLSRYDGLGLDPRTRTVPARITVENPQQFTLNGTSSDAIQVGPPALVRGMFVDAAIKTRPTRDYLLIPKIALRPGDKAWEFTGDSTVLEIVAERARKKREKDNADGNNPPAPDAPVEPSEEIKKINPDDWIAGRIDVARDVVALRLFVAQDDLQEYWVAEPHPDLSAGDELIITPITNANEDGTDYVRVEKSTLPDAERAPQGQGTFSVKTPEDPSRDVD